MEHWMPSAALGLITIAGHVFNWTLNLKLRDAMRTMKDEVLTEVASEYKRADVCAAEMKRVDGQLTAAGR